MKVLIRSAKLIDNKSDKNNELTDILIENGKITKIESNISVKDDYQIVEKENLHVSPGWFDPSVSFGEPGYEENETLETGIAAAAAGGFTAVAMLPNTNPPVDSKADIEFLIKRSSYKAVNIHPIGALTKKREAREMSESFDMSQSGAIAFGDDKSIGNEKLMEISLLYNKTIGKPVLSFPDTESISHLGQMNEGVVSTNLGLKGIPSLSEELRVNRDIFLVEYTQGKLHFQNISTKKSVELIKKAKADGLDITAQVSVNNLVLTDSELESFDTNFKLMPPLRTKEDVKALIKGLKNGTIDFVTSDHRPKDVERKFKEFDHASFGSIGLESCFSALNTALHREMDINAVVDLLCDKPRQRFGLERPVIEVGAKAEITLFNPEEEIVFDESFIKSQSKNSAFLNKKLKGRVYGVLNNNELLLN